MSDPASLTDKKLVGTLIFASAAGSAHEEIRGACIAELHRRLNERQEQRDRAEAELDRTLRRMKELVAKAHDAGLKLGEL